MIYINSFKLSPHTVLNPNIYPYNVFKKIAEEVFIFDKITILYGNNGSGKSTLLNIIANKLDIKGSENLTYDYPLSYLSDCSYRLGGNKNDGETSMQIFDEYLVPSALYLLDEPETSLSPANQIQLAENINQLARFFDCQCIVATHSPFMLGILGARIYNLDAPQLKTCEWHELENVRFFNDFFKERKSEFE